MLRTWRREEKAVETMALWRELRQAEQKERGPRLENLPNFISVNFLLFQIEILLRPKEKNKNRKPNPKRSIHEAQPVDDISFTVQHSNWNLKAQTVSTQLSIILLRVKFGLETYFNIGKRSITTY